MATINGFLTGKKRLAEPRGRKVIFIMSRDYEPGVYHNEETAERLTQNQFDELRKGRKVISIMNRDYEPGVYHNQSTGEVLTQNELDELRKGITKTENLLWIEIKTYRQPELKSI